MPLDFPSSPTNGQYYNGFVYNAANQTWDSAYAPRPATIPISTPNVIINGAMDIWQRGTSFSNPAYVFTADRWRPNFNGTGAAVTVSRQSFSPGDLSVQGFGSPAYFYRYNQTSAGTGATFSNVISQVIEDVNTLAGQTATVSFWAKADSAKSITVALAQSFGSGGSSPVYSNFGTQTIGTTWQRYVYTGTVPSISGKTVGSSSGLELTLQTSSLNTTQTIDIWGVQMEAGAAATDFRRNAPSIQGELAACQRYYWRQASSTSAYTIFANGFVRSAYNAELYVVFPVSMRTKPSSFESSALATIGLAGPGSTGSVTSLAMDSATASDAGAVLNAGSGPSLTVGLGQSLLASNSTSAYIAFSAEL